MLLLVTPPGAKSQASSRAGTGAVWFQQATRLLVLVFIYCLPLCGSSIGGLIPTKTITGPFAGIGDCTGGPLPLLMATLPLIAVFPDICTPVEGLGPLIT